jgi:hypothetical protein
VCQPEQRDTFPLAHGDDYDAIYEGEDELLVQALEQLSQSSIGIGGW